MESDGPREGLGPERTELLLHATKVLFSSLELDKTLRTLADLCVPAFSDWCAVHLLGPKRSVKPVAVAFADPSWRETVEEWQRSFPVSLEDATGVGQVIRTSTPLYIPQFTSELRQAAYRGPEHARYVAKLDPKSVLIVPIAVHDKTHGALTLLHTTSGRSFTPADARFAEELAFRAAIAVENARFYQDERRARERIERLQRATADLARSRTPSGIARALLRSLGPRDLPTEAVVTLASPDGERLRIVEGGGPWHGLDLALSASGELGRAAVGRRPLTLRGAAPLEGLPEGNWLVLPLADGSTLQGVLAVRDETDPPSADHSFLEALADQAGQALARARLEEAVLFQNTLLESQNEAALDGIFFQDAQARAVFWNQRLLEMWGVSDEIPKNEKIEERLALSMDRLADPQAFYDLVMDMERKRDATLRTDLRLKDGKIFDCYSAPVRDKAGEYRGRVWFYRDVTQRRLAEEELVNARRRLAQSEKLAALGSLVSGVAHEIRTPLGYAANHAYLLSRAVESLDTPDAARVRESSAAILESVDRINRLVQDLRRFIRVGSTASSDVDEAVDAAIRLFEATHRGQVRLRIDLSARARVDVDRLQLQQIVLNLLENAADASPAGAPVHVKAAADDQSVTVTVRDEGSGVPAEVKGKMWEPFFTTKPEGTGLGLSIVRRIVEASDGSIECVSEPGKGATFVVKLPQARESGPKR